MPHRQPHAIFRGPFPSDLILPGSRGTWKGNFQRGLLIVVFFIYIYFVCHFSSGTYSPLHQNRNEESLIIFTVLNHISKNRLTTVATLTTRASVHICMCTMKLWPEWSFRLSLKSHFFKLCRWLCVCVCVCVCVCACANYCGHVLISRSLLCNRLCAQIRRNST